MSSSSSYLLATMNFNTLSEVCSFLPFGTLARVRLVSRFFNEFACSDDLWAVLCTSYRVPIGELADLDDPNVDPELEPNPFKLMDGPQEGTEQCLPWQLAVASWQGAIRANGSPGCTHVTVGMLVKALPVWKRRMESYAVATKKRGVPPPPSQRCSVEGCPAGVYSLFACVGCGELFCSMAARGHMSSHARDNHVRNVGATTEGISSALGAASGCSSVYAVQVDDGELRCYNCGGVRACDPYQVPGDVLDYLETARDPHVRISHMGLFLRNQCPHLDINRLKNFGAKFDSLRRRLGNDGRNVFDRKCQHPQCSSLKVYVCVHCCNFFCGASKGGHMHQHCHATGHCIVVALRRLDVWCYSCDRYLGTKQGESSASVVSRGEKATDDPFASSELDDDERETTLVAELVSEVHQNYGCVLHRSFGQQPWDKRNRGPPILQNYPGLL